EHGLGVWDDAGRSDEHQHWSHLLLDHGCNGIDGLGISHVAGEETSARCLGNSRAAGLIHIDDGDRVAVGSQFAGRGLADATGAARDDGDTLAGHSLLLILANELVLLRHRMLPVWRHAAWRPQSRTRRPNPDN